MSNKIKALLTVIDAATKDFLSGLPAIQKKSFNRLMLLVKDLEVDKLGNIKTNLYNIKLINSIDKELNDIILNKPYLKSVANFVKTFDAVDKLQGEYFASITNKFTPSKVLEAVKKVTVDQTIDQLTENGIAANYTDKVKELLVRNITGGGQYSDFTESIRKTIIGKEGEDGKLVRYSKQIVIDSINQYNRTYTKTITDDLGLVWYRYTGSLLTTSRDFCKAMINLDYFHVSEIPDMLKGKIGSTKVAINSNNNLPFGMIEGTNSNNFITNLGGYQCGHTVFPVITESVPQNIRSRIK